MNDARKRHSSVVYRDRLYVLGGTDAEGNSMEVLELKRNYPKRPYQSGKSLYEFVRKVQTHRMKNRLKNVWFEKYVKMNVKFKINSKKWL
jgi:hypothetical protein